MRYQTPDCQFTFEPFDEDGIDFLVELAVRHGERLLHFRNGDYSPGGDDTRRSLRAFQAFESASAQVELSKDSWIRLTRQPRGDLRVRVRLEDIYLRSTAEAEFEVEGEYANGFVRDLVAVIDERGYQRKMETP